MNPVIISRPLNSFDVGQLDAAIYVINTNLSAPEFDAVFRDAINDYIAGRAEFEPAVQRTLAAAQQCVEDSPEHVAALDLFMVEHDKQTAFEDNNKIFEHSGQKILLTKFIENYTLPTDFDVMSLQDWLKMKEEETTSRFSDE
jgi:hypothetical protein